MYKKDPSLVSSDKIAAPDKSEIETLLSVLSNELGNVHRQIGNLSENLRPVRRDIGAEAAGDHDANPPPANSPIGQSLQGLIQQTFASQQLLDDIQNSLAI